MIRGSFGLSLEYRLAVHRSMFNLITYGGGGWTMDVVYNLPLHLRNFYINELVKGKQKEHDVMEAQTQRKHYKPPNR